MRKIVQAFCSAVCVMSLTLPADVLASVPGDSDDAVEDQLNLLEDNDDQALACTLRDFEGGENLGADLAECSGVMVLFLHRPDGRVVTDAQVVTTLVDPDGGQTMERARPFFGGYLIASAQLPPGAYRVEAEIVTDGRLLTDQFSFNKT